jgi:hypothetical protein
MRRAVLLLSAAVAAAFAGCGLGQGEERRGAGAELRVTRDFGQRSLYRGREPRVRSGLTVMRLLQSRRRVETRYGGKFVQAIDGLEGHGATGSRDWFYFVNGIEAGLGAAERAVHPGDVIHWDYRRWDRAMSVPAIVGAFPEPFLHGDEGRRIPVRLECEDARAAACAEAQRRLSAAGVNASRAELGTAASDTLRVVVGRWLAVRGVKAAAPLAGGPERSGVFVRMPAADRGRMDLLDPTGRAARAAPPGTGLVAATGLPDQPPVWILTGLDDAGVRRAASSLDPRVLRDAYSVAATPGGPLPLPLDAERHR